MLFRQLEYFVALAREQHFARAAAACYVSQPALSESIRKLEHELGVPLVNRGHTFEGLTPEGERLVSWARRILADHDALVHEVAAMQSGLDGRLRLGVVPAATTTAALMVQAFCSAHPQARVALDTALTTSEIVERLAHFELDAGIAYLGDGDAAVHAVHLYDQRHALVATRQLVGDPVAQLRWSELAQLPLCMLAPSMRGRQLVDEALEAHGMRLCPEVETDSIASIYALAATGRWAGIVPHPWFYPFELEADARLVPLIEPTVTSSVGLMIRSAEPASVLATAFAAAAKAVAFDELFAPSGPPPPQIPAGRLG